MAKDDEYDGEYEEGLDEEFDDLEDEGPSPTPFDHPLFLPGLLFAFAVWFGYDGFFSEAMKEKGHQAFNRWGFGAFAIGTIWTGIKGLREMREASESSGGDDDPFRG